MNDSHSSLRKLVHVSALLAMSFCTYCVAETLSDPTQPPSAHENIAIKPEFALRLEGVLGSATQRRAIVDGKLVRIGDRIGGALITDISDETVSYTFSGRERVAHLNRDHVVVRQPTINRDKP
jgi:hypothetical protein